MSPVLKYKDPATGIWTALPATAWPPNEVVSHLLPSGQPATASMAYINWPSSGGGPLAATLNKRAASTALVVDMTMGGYVNIAGLIEWGVLIDGIDYLVNRCFYNQAGCHFEWGARRSLSGFGIGPRTATLRVKTSGNTLNCDSADTYSMSLREVTG